MFKVVMTMKEFSVYVREGIYSLRFAVLLLTFIILLFIIMQICESLCSFIRLAQQNLENNEQYGPAGIIMRSSNKFKRKHSGKTSQRRGRTNKEVVVQLSSSSEESRGRNREEIFDEKSMEVLKSSSFPASLVSSNSLNYSRKLLEEDFLKRKYMTNEGAEGKKSLAVIIDSPSKESYTQIVTDSTISSGSAFFRNF